MLVDVCRRRNGRKTDRQFDMMYCADLSAAAAAAGDSLAVRVQVSPLAGHNCRRRNRRSRRDGERRILRKSRVESRDSISYPL